MWLSKEITLKARGRGFHLITEEIFNKCPEISGFSVGLVNLFLQHTSASITINENADPSVRSDFSSWLRRSIPDNASYFSHILEGDDDMTAHIKSSLIGVSLNIPLRDGRLALGTWQGIYLGEHREYAGSRKLLITINGESIHEQKQQY